MEYHYDYENCCRPEFVTDNIYEILHELICDLCENISELNAKINIIVKPAEGKKHILNYDTLKLNGMVLKSECGKSFDLRKVEDVDKIILLYSNNPTHNKKINSVYKTSMVNMINKLCCTNNPIKQNIASTNFMADVFADTYYPSKKSVNNLSNDVSETLKTISELAKNINTAPTVGKVRFRDEIDNKNKEKSWRQNFTENVTNSTNKENEQNIDDERDTYGTDSDSDSSDASDSTESEISFDEINLSTKQCKNDNFFSKTFNTKKIKSQYENDLDTNSDCDSDLDSDTDSDPEITELKNEIRKMEQLKTETSDIVKTLETSLKDEKENLSKYNCVVNEEAFKLRKERDRIERDYNIFVSEKEHTYGIIYNKFFIKKEIRDWDCVSPLFMIKFPIYLYLDGKNTKGEKVRDRILDTADDFRLYRLLYDSITDPDFEMPEDDNELNMVVDFIETFPQSIPIVTEADIMERLNNADVKHKRIFEEDETSQNSGSDNEYEHEPDNANIIGM